MARKDIAHMAGSLLRPCVMVPNAIKLHQGSPSQSALQGSLYGYHLYHVGLQDIFQIKNLQYDLSKY